jgi:hypothetical protein
MLKLLRKIIEIKLFVIGLIALLWSMKKKHHYCHNEKEIDNHFTIVPRHEENLQE